MLADQNGEIEKPTQKETTGQKSPFTSFADRAVELGASPEILGIVRKLSKTRLFNHHGADVKELSMIYNTFNIPGGVVFAVGTLFEMGYMYGVQDERKRLNVRKKAARKSLEVG